MKIPNWFTIVYEDPKWLSQIDLKKIYEIEQDMWAEWIWEYVKCECCSIIYSKKDIFGHLSNDIYLKTVWQIEKILDLDNIKCKKCDSNTVFLWWKNYINDIKERYNDKNAFLITLRDTNWKIKGFSDAYISDFHTIYKREFEYYYSDIWEEKIQKIIESTIWYELPETLLMHSTVWIEAEISNLNMFLVILQNFYEYLQCLWYWDILWIYESSIGTTIHSIYHASWAERLWIDINKDYKNNVNNEYISDIFIHNNIINSYITKLDIWIKGFIKLNSLKMKEVLNK